MLPHFCLDVGWLPLLRNSFFGKTQNSAHAVSRKMKDTVGVLGANLDVSNHY